MLSSIERISWLITIHFEPGNVHPSGVSCLLVVAEGGPLVREDPFRSLVPETCFLWGDLHHLPECDLFQTWKHHREWLIIFCDKWEWLLVLAEFGPLFENGHFGSN